MSDMSDQSGGYEEPAVEADAAPFEIEVTLDGQVEATPAEYNDPSMPTGG
jgi:hypothetical protein